jgi:nicotinate-nucleotide--dimethylbenzimidazole phosphoribosyltransferase
LEIKSILESIQPVSEEYLQKARKHTDNLAIPRGSLGRLTELGSQYLAIRQNLKSRITKKEIFTFAADHGVVAEGVSAFPGEVTRQMVLNFIAGGAGVNVLARHVGSRVTVVDIGVNYDFNEIDGLIIKKIARGTGNIAKEPAMTRDEALKAIGVGVELARKSASAGVDIIGTGDMGIGNTTPSSAIIAVLSGLPVSEVTSRGTGICDESLNIKIKTIEKALSLHNPAKDDPIDILCKVGGFEIAGIAGLIIGAAFERIPVVIDGFISTAGAIIAYEMNHVIGEYIYASHLSVEKGHRIMLDWMGLKPLLDLNLRLGEGTGAALGISLVEAGVRLVTEMLTFDEAGVTEGSCV